jgi:hypothetical protein
MEELEKGRQEQRATLRAAGGGGLAQQYGRR